MYLKKCQMVNQFKMTFKIFTQKKTLEKHLVEEDYMFVTSRRPYENKLKYDTKHFTVRMVQEHDAEDLLSCYSDPKAAPLFNSDNCTGDFIYDSVEDVRSLIKFWKREYEQGYYVRFALVFKERNKAIGTLEMFAKEKVFEEVGSVGVLRIDLASEYERKQYIDEIMSLVCEFFFEDFGVQNIITKSVPQAKERITSLKAFGYKPVVDLELSGQCKEYYIGRATV